MVRFECIQHLHVFHLIDCDNAVTGTAVATQKAEAATARSPAAVISHQTPAPGPTPEVFAAATAELEAPLGSLLPTVLCQRLQWPHPGNMQSSQAHRRRQKPGLQWQQPAWKAR
jgi:hypothetical protein